MENKKFSKYGIGKKTTIETWKMENMESTQAESGIKLLRTYIHDTVPGTLNYVKSRLDPG